MRFGIAIPQFFADGQFDPAAFRTYLARVEELGFESAWTQEQVLGAWPQFSPMEAMTYAAACTQRLRLGCVVFVSTLHNPVHLAKSLSTLDQLSGGRIDVGVGTGGKGRPFAAFGVDPQRYVARFSEGVELMKRLWTEPRVTFDGEFWQLQDAAMEPKPFTKPHPPLWFGAAGPTALCGWAPGSSARVRRRRTGSRNRSRSCGRSWPGRAGPPRASRSRSGCTSRWMTTRLAPASG
jgi:alkanesulfonate monooxygenase SsuD/methylene tetrahydromethanopterin reductase-like flavin-dependent oxidoreductase (luciferase family)